MKKGLTRFLVGCVLGLTVWFAASAISGMQTTDVRDFLGGYRDVAILWAFGAPVLSALLNGVFLLAISITGEKTHLYWLTAGVFLAFVSSASGMVALLNGITASGFIFGQVSAFTSLLLVVVGCIGLLSGRFGLNRISRAIPAIVAWNLFVAIAVGEIGMEMTEVNATKTQFIVFYVAYICVAYVICNAFAYRHKILNLFAHHPRPLAHA